MWIWDACAKQSTNESIIYIFITLFLYRDVVANVFSFSNDFVQIHLPLMDLRVTLLVVMDTIRENACLFMLWHRSNKRYENKTLWIFFPILTMTLKFEFQNIMRKHDQTRNHKDSNFFRLRSVELWILDWKLFKRNKFAVKRNRFDFWKKNKRIFHELGIFYGFRLIITRF